jgi:hypothetical protein
MHILIIINMVYGGAITTTQEFADKHSCEAAIAVVREMVSSRLSSRGPVGVACVSKAREGKNAND